MSQIPTGRVPYLDIDIPKLVCGSDFFMGQAPYQTFDALDRFWEAGGRCFDTAHNYGPNSSILNAWATYRGVKKEIIHLDKGSHPYHNEPSRVRYEYMLHDIKDNQVRLGTDYTHFYVFHRDDPAVPISEIVDGINEIIKMGLIGAYGGSNWTIARIEEANAYAEANGKQGLSLNNPNLTLAENVKPLWDGCITIDKAGRDWHEKTQLPLFSWSSTARGYFAEIKDEHMLASYDSEVSRGRLARAKELGAKYELSATQIALAWVLNQPFPAFALCGLRHKDNVAENVAASTLKLTPAELTYLENGV